MVLNVGIATVGIGMHAGIPTLTLYLSVVWIFIFKKITVLTSSMMTLLMMNKFISICNPNLLLLHPLLV